MKTRYIILIAIAVLIAPAFIAAYNLGLLKVFAPATENVKREVFENTKSYMHGVQQDLGKYYLEYQSTDDAGKGAIRATIQMRFAEVDSSKIQNRNLRSFLESVRGY